MVPEKLIAVALELLASVENADPMLVSDEILRQAARFRLLVEQTVELV